MTSPLDKRGLEAAMKAFSPDDDVQAIYTPYIASAISTYLSAVALPDELEVVAYLVKDDPELGDYLTKSRQAAERSSYGHIRLTDADQAHSTIAALRVERDEARAYASESSTAKLEVANRTLLDKLVAAEENRDAGVRNLLTMQDAANKLRARAETAESEVKRLTEDNEALRKKLEPFEPYLASRRDEKK